MRRALQSYGLEPDLDTILAACCVERYPAPTSGEVAAEFGTLLAQLRHVNDVALAVAVKLAHPDAFVSSNHRHWHAGLYAPLGGVLVFRPRDFIQWIIPPP